jgi:hypothetical protein
LASAEAWERGGQLEDQLVREAARPGDVTPGRIAKMEQISARLQVVTAALVEDSLEAIASGSVAVDALLAEPREG